MMKNKITQEIKDAFLEEIKKTRDSGKEHGFLICLENDNNKNGRLFVSKKRCIGDECAINIENVDCPDIVQGAFHTHPNLTNVIRLAGRKLSEREADIAIKIYKKRYEEHGIPLTTPSHHDLTDTLLNQCLGQTVGTLCTGTDLDLEKVECWTVKKDKVNVNHCIQANEEHKEIIGERPRKWIKPLFDREIISLKTKKWWI